MKDPPPGHCTMTYSGRRCIHPVLKDRPAHTGSCARVSERRVKLPYNWRIEGRDMSAQANVIPHGPAPCLFPLVGRGALWTALLPQGCGSTWSCAEMPTARVMGQLHRRACATLRGPALYTGRLYPPQIGTGSYPALGGPKNTYLHPSNGWAMLRDKDRLLSCERTYLPTSPKSTHELCPTGVPMLRFLS